LLGAADSTIAADASCQTPQRASSARHWQLNILNAVGQLPDVGLSELRADGASGPG